MLPRIVLALTLALAALPPAAGAVDARLARMATGSLAGAYFPVGVALCRLVNETRRTHGIRCSAQPSEGSVANIEALRAGEVDFAIVQSDVQNDALRGGGAFSGEPAFDDLRAVMALHPEPLTVVARADAGIKRFEDLFGKRISYGRPGSGARGVWDNVAGRMGWDQRSFAATLELDPEQQPAALCDGRVDAFSIELVRNGRPLRFLTHYIEMDDGRRFIVEYTGSEPGYSQHLAAVSRSLETLQFGVRP